MREDWKYYGCIFVTGCLWGTNGVFIKLMEQAGSSSLYTGFIRLLFSFLILLIITLVKDGVKAFKVSKKTLISCVMLGLLCQALYNYLYTTTISLLGMSLGSVMTYMSPVFASILSFFIFREKFGMRKYVALVMNLVGCALTVTGGKLDGFHFAVSGVLFGVAAAFIYSLSGILGRFATDEGSAFAVCTYNFLFGVIFLGLFSHPWTTVEMPMDKTIWFYGFLYALLPTAIGYIFYFVGLSGVKESSKVPVVASVENVVAVMIGVYVFHELIGLGNVIGIAMVLGSIAVMNLEGKRHDKVNNY